MIVPGWYNSRIQLSFRFYFWINHDSLGPGPGPGWLAAQERLMDQYSTLNKSCPADGGAHGGVMLESGKTAVEAVEVSFVDVILSR